MATRKAVKEQDIPEAEGSWKVVSADGRRTLFEGPEHAATQYIENHFPHVHVEPNGNTEPAPDVYLSSPNGDQYRYAGGEWDEETDETPPVTDQGTE